MGAKTIEELVAWQLAHELKVEIYRIARTSPAAMQNFEYRNQLFGAAASGESNVAEGFYRFLPREFARFLDIARASMGEARVRLLDGVDRGYFPASECTAALKLAERAMGCAVALKKSLDRYQGRGPGT